MFAPNFITRVATTIATVPFAISVGLVAPEAKAAECVYGNNYQLCFEYVASIGNNVTRWNVQLNNNHTTENMTVDCNGKSMDRWSSRGGASQSEAAFLAETFCAL
jgi:hypothetical protein